MTVPTPPALRRTLLAALLALGMASSARADDGGDRHTAAAAVLTQLHSADMVGSILPTIIGQIKTNLTHNDPDLVKQFDAYAPHLRAEGEASTGQLMDKLIDVYARTFTLDELHDMLAYYQSPVGQRIIATQAVVNHDMLVAARDWGMTLAQTLAREAAAELQGTKPDAPQP